MTCPMMISLGVYALGAADAEERTRVETHLPGCAECQAELIRLAPLPGLLAVVPDDMRPAARTAGARTGPPSGPPRRRTRPVGSRARATLGGHLSRPLRAAAVAACVAVAGGFALGSWLTPAGPGHARAGETFTGINPSTRVAATAALTPTSWGTSIQLRLQGVPLNIECRLIARSRSGATEVTGVWDAWSKGPVSIPASSGWRESDIASLQVVAGTRTLVTIDTRDRPAAPANS